MNRLNMNLSVKIKPSFNRGPFDPSLEMYKLCNKETLIRKCNGRDFLGGKCNWFKTGVCTKLEIDEGQWCWAWEWLEATNIEELKKL